MLLKKKKQKKKTTMMLKKLLVMTWLLTEKIKIRVLQTLSEKIVGLSVTNVNTNKKTKNSF